MTKTKTFLKNEIALLKQNGYLCRASTFLVLFVVISLSVSVALAHEYPDGITPPEELKTWAYEFASAAAKADQISSESTFDDFDEPTTDDQTSAASDIYDSADMTTEDATMADSAVADPAETTTEDTTMADSGAADPAEITMPAEPTNTDSALERPDEMATEDPSTSSLGFKHPGGITTAAQIRTAATHINANKQPWMSKWKRLLREANSKLNEKPSAVVHLNIPGYYSNQSASVHAASIMQRDVFSAYPAAAVYAINAAMSGNAPKSDKYADQAIRILNDWAQTNKGFSGDNAGLTPCTQLISLVQAAEFVYDYPGWRARDRGQFIKWAKTVLYDQAEIKSRGMKGNWFSNWNDWGILMALAVDYLADDKAQLSKDTEMLKDLIRMQIEPDGSLPKEVRRGSNGIVYTAFALEPLTAAVEIVRNAGGPDLRHWDPPGGGSIKKALDFLYNNGFENPNRWPVSSARYNRSNEGVSDEIFAAMARVYGVRKWANFHTPDLPDLWTAGGWVAPELLEPTP